MRQIEEDPEGAGTAHLHSATQKISELANHAFQPMFARQVQAEKIRLVHGMLQRFRTLFNLPSVIHGSISKEEYDLAVREYRKAKSIVLLSHVANLITFYPPLWGIILSNGFTYYQVNRMLNSATRMDVGMSDRSYQLERSRQEGLFYQS